MWVDNFFNIQYPVLNVIKSAENICRSIDNKLLLRYKLGSRYLSTHDSLQASWYKMLFSINQEDNKSSRCDQMVFTQFESIWFALYKSPSVQHWTLDTTLYCIQTLKLHLKPTKPGLCIVYWVVDTHLF